MHTTYTVLQQCPKHAPNMSKTFPKHVPNMSQTCLKHILVMSWTTYHQAYNTFMFSLSLSISLPVSFCLGPKKEQKPSSQEGPEQVTKTLS
jgi:hypothetical protein